MGRSRGGGRESHEKTREPGSCDPATGQFLSRDPLEAMTREPYGYAGNDPINRRDPTGLAPCGCGPPTFQDLYNCLGWFPPNISDDIGSQVLSTAKVQGAQWLAEIVFGRVFKRPDVAARIGSRLNALTVAASTIQLACEHGTSLGAAGADPYAGA